MSFLFHDRIASPSCYLRFFHALPSAQSFDVYLDGNKITKDFLYEDFTVYLPLTHGEHELTVCAYETTEPLYTRKIWLSKQRIYTFVLASLPHDSTLQGYLINEPPKAIPEEHLLMRVANFSAYTAPMTLHLVDTKPIFKKIPLRQTGSYLSFLPATTPVELMDVETQKVLCATKASTFKISRYYTLYLIGGMENYPLKWVQTIDGNSFLHFVEN